MSIGTLYQILLPLYWEQKRLRIRNITKFTPTKVGVKYASIGRYPWHIIYFYSHFSGSKMSLQEIIPINLFYFAPTLVGVKLMQSHLYQQFSFGIYSHLGGSKNIHSIVPSLPQIIFCSHFTGSKIIFTRIWHRPTALPWNKILLPTTNKKVHDTQEPYEIPDKRTYVLYLFPKHIPIPNEIAANPSFSRLFLS